VNAGSSNLLQDAGGLYGLLLTLVFLAFIWVALLSLTRDLWRIVFLYETRRAPTLGIGSAIAIGVYILAGLTLGAKHYAAMMFAVVALGPWLGMARRCVKRLWKFDPSRRPGCARRSPGPIRNCRGADICST